jgi:RNA polymerase sigma factor (sigma-70 family)
MKYIKYFDGKKTIKIETTEEVAQTYQEIKKTEWRQEKAKKRHEQFSLNALSDAGMQFIDEESDIEFHLIAEEERKEKDKLFHSLKKALSTLNVEQQKIVKLKFYENKDETEIGRILGITKQSAQDRLKVIYKKLKKFLEK